jgi:hypothetical protein
MAHDEVATYACDGNRRWDLHAIREWWSERRTVLSWARTCLATTKDDSARYEYGGKEASDHRALRALIEYYESSAAEDLRRYAFYLSEGRLAGPDETLPTL